MRAYKILVVHVKLMHDVDSRVGDQILDIYMPCGTDKALDEIFIHINYVFRVYLEFISMFIVMYENLINFLYCGLMVLWMLSDLNGIVDVNGQKNKSKNNFFFIREFILYPSCV